MESSGNGGGFQWRVSERDGFAFILMENFGGLVPLMFWTRNCRYEWEPFKSEHYATMNKSLLPEFERCKKHVDLLIEIDVDQKALECQKRSSS